MIAVLDTSAAIDVLLKKGEVNSLFKKIETADIVIAPEIYISEISNTAWKYNKLANFIREESISLAEDGIHLIDKFIPVNELWKEALRESINYDHPVYDFLYVVCARRNDGILLTKDIKLQKICKKLKIRIL
jgi:predicted nucleic acid-binding protein